MKILRENLRQTEITQRRNFLIRQLHNLEIYKTIDGRELEDCSLYTLEWVHITEKNKFAEGFND
ncbi:Fur-regulated basic protein FbpA [Virgibacillus alimentarius]|uniref:Fur-regulated basic protein FbpA n=1 Tax=Virgibacillus alimentarius TaxID=698769 RepID=UPI00068D11C3